MWSTRRIIKYVILLFCGFMALKPILPIGDYSSGMATGMLMILFGSILVFIYFIAFIRNIERVYNGKDRFDWMLTAIFCTFILLFFMVRNADEGKFWTHPVLKSEITSNDIPSHGGEIILYENNSFAAVRTYVDFSEVYQGNYTVSHDTLYLDRPDLPKFTENIISTTYTIDSTAAQLTPCKKGYNTLHIHFIEK